MSDPLVKNKVPMAHTLVKKVVEKTGHPRNLMTGNANVDVNDYEEEAGTVVE